MSLMNFAKLIFLAPFDYISVVKMNKAEENVRRLYAVTDRGPVGQSVIWWAAEAVVLPNGIIIIIYKDFFLSKCVQEFTKLKNLVQMHHLTRYV